MPYAVEVVITRKVAGKNDDRSIRYSNKAYVVDAVKITDLQNPLSPIEGQSLLASKDHGSTSPAIDAIRNIFAVKPESVSKVVDGNGAPLVVYHTTNTEFNVFDKRKSREGFFFSPNKERLYVYNKGKTFSFFLDIKKPSHEIGKHDVKYLQSKNYDG